MRGARRKFPKEGSLRKGIFIPFRFSAREPQARKKICGPKK